MTAHLLREELYAQKDSQKAFILQRFFKTGPGEYGEGDIFWGLKVPETRAIALRYRSMPLPEVEILLKDPVHEVRMAAGMVLVERFKKSNTNEREAIYNFYLRNAACFNNWDLVDLTCPAIVGGWLLNKDKSPLFELAASSNLWEQRIGMVSTLFLIRNKQLETTFEIALVLLNHQHDLIQKAVGWMLREAGKKNLLREIEFLLENDRYKTMPRTMLRYAIEKFPESQRMAFLKGTA